MGLISSTMDDDFAKAKVGAKKMDTGIQNATITKLELVADKEKITRPWVDVELVVTYENVETGGRAWQRLEMMPLTDKDGNPSPGKLGFVKGQLEAMGFVGKLSELERSLDGLRGAIVRINVEDEISKKMNPKTNKPYVNREVYGQELIEAGAGGTSSGAAKPSDDFVAPDDDDDDDLPF